MSYIDSKIRFSTVRHKLGFIVFPDGFPNLRPSFSAVNRNEGGRERVQGISVWYFFRSRLFFSLHCHMISFAAVTIMIFDVKFI
jgi:hypothetical protein